MARTSVLLSSGDGYVGVLLKLPQGCQGPFQGSKGKMGFLLRPHGGKGPYLALRGESPGFSRVAAANLGFLSMYDGKLSDPHMWPQECPVSMRVVSVLSEFLCSRWRGRGPHLKLRLEPQGSSSMLTWISVFLWSFQRGVSPRLVWRHASQLSY